MLLVTSLQVFLLLLSAPRQLFAFRYYDLEDVGFYGARGTDAECDAHLVIKSWINEQIVTNAKLTSLNLNLGKVLDVINNTNPNQAGEEHCCFYENKTMSTIFKGLGKLTTTSDTPNTNPLEATGDLGKDLDIILDQLKAISSKKMKTCCEKLAENLKTVEADLMKELEEVRRKLKKQHGEVNDQADKLKKKQTDLENQLKSVTNRIEELEKQQKVNKEEAAKCCKELNDKVNELNKQLEQAKAEASKKAKQLEKDINDLNQKQQEHANKLDILQKETEKHGTIIAQTTQVCIDNCGNGTGNGPGTGSGTGNGNGSGTGSTGIEELQNKIKELEQMIVNLVEKFNQLSNLSIATANCSKIMEELIEIQNTLNQLGNQTSGNNNCPSLAELQAEIEKAKQCCNRIDALSQKLDDMMKQIEELKNNYTKHVTQLETSLSQVQEKIDNAFAQLQNISTAIQTCTNGNGTDESEAQAKRLADLQNQVNSLKTILNMTQTNLNINEAKLVQLDKTLDEKWKEFQKLNADRLKNLTEFKDQTEKRLYELQLLLSNSSSAPDQNLTERVIKLEKLHEKMLVDIQRILELQTMILNLENQLKEALQKLKDHDAKFAECALKCSMMDELDDMIDRLEDLEHLIFRTTGGPSSTPKPTTPKRTTTKRTTTKRTTPRPTRRSTPISIIGSIDNPKIIYKRPKRNV